LTKFYRQKLPPETHLLPPARKYAVHPFIHWMWNTMNDQARSQQDVADQAKVSASAMRRWRTGDREPSLQGIEAVINALGYELVIRRRERSE
jgi:DNA-binding phage protein